MSENAATREPHIVFQVMNFIFSDDPLNEVLLPIHRMLLLALAKHKGQKGIYPSTSTLAKRLKITTRYVKTCLQFLEDKKLIRIERSTGKSSHYFLDFLSTTGEPQFTSELQFTGESQITTPVNSSSPHRCSTVHPISINNKYKRNNTERGRTKTRPFPLPENFEPGKAAIARAREANLSEKEANESFEMFMNHHIGKGTTAVNWQLMLSNWFIREAKIKAEKQKKFNGAAKPEIRSTVPWYQPEPLEVKRHELGREGKGKASQN